MNKDLTLLRHPLHPFLFALLAPLLVLSQNSIEVAPGAALRTLVLSLVLTAALVFLLRKFLHDVADASLVATLLVGHFYLYGRLYTGNVHGVIREAVFRAGLPGHHGPVLLAVLALLAISVFAASRLDLYRDTISLLLNVVGLSLLVGISAGVVRTEWILHRPVSAASIPVTAPVGLEDGATSPPDIYYIVLDGYGREDVLATIYKHDNSHFLSFLRANGFRVVDGAHSNYMQTSLSLASTLNLAYLDGLIDTRDSATGDPRLTTARLIRNSRLAAFLTDRGYGLLQIAGGYRPSRLEASRALQPRSPHANLFERLMIENSAFAVLSAIPGVPEDLEHPGYRLHRERIRYALSELPQATDQADRPLFVYAHILAPHPPFVFDRAGAGRNPGYPFVLLDGSAYPGERESYRMHYRDQLIFVNEGLESALGELLEGPGQDAIILIGADHGPGSRLDWESLERTDARERFAILLAYRMPAGEAAPYPDIRSAVNLFRMVLTRQFGADLPPLPERAYYSTWSDPLRFEQVDEEKLEPIRP